MEQFMAERNIRRVFHFTQADNLNSILTYGIYPRSILDQSGINALCNDLARFDYCENAVCASIEFPNYKTFYTFREADRSKDWVVIELDANVLLDYECAFCRTNAAKTSVSTIPLSLRKTKEAFFDMFSDNPNMPSRRQIGLLDCCPTDPQAEVLIFGIIPTKYIRHVHFQNRNAFNKYLHAFLGKANARVTPNLFSYRGDWEYWTVR